MKLNSYDTGNINVLLIKALFILGLQINIPFYVTRIKFNFGQYECFKGAIGISNSTSYARHQNLLESLDIVYKQW